MSDNYYNRKMLRKTSCLASSAALAFALLSGPVHAQSEGSQTSQAEAEPAPIGEIVVTATRKATALSRTPASIVAKGQEELDVQGVRSIADIASVTPGITFGQSATVYGTGQTTIAIRGVDSQSGIPTTGVYIDDTPIQTRVGVSPSLGNVYPQVFDLERVEVLRGPQGTLFGSGSVGGAIRFIMPKPNYDDVSIYSRAEVASTKHGAISYEGGVAAGAPIVDGKIGMRVSVWHRRDGGYIDRLDPYTKELVEKNSNETDSTSARLALGFRVGNNLTLTPSIFFQHLDIADGSRFELAQSDLSSGNQRLSLNHRKEGRKDKFYLPALKAELDLGAVTLISDTSYFRRTTETINDDTSLSFVFTGGITEEPFPAGFEDYMPYTFNDTKQTAFTQELRLQDNNQNDRFNWIAGLFYQKSEVVDAYQASDPRFLDVLNLGQIAAGEPTFPSLTDSFFGTELYKGKFSNAVRNEHRDRQYAAYAQADYEIIDRLKLTAGLRYTKAKYKFEGFFAGPVLSSDGQTDRAKTSSSTFTPKFGISFQADRDNLFYGTISKGVRGSGVASPVGSFCNADAAAIGIDPLATLDVKPDSIWSYEVGAKNRLFGGLLSLDVSAYRIDWKDIQSLITLPTCTIQTTLNLGTAKIDGFDASVVLRPAQGLTLGASVAYTNARYTSSVPGPNDTVIRKKGEPFNSVSPWMVQLNGEYIQPVGDADIYGRADFSYSSKIQKSIDLDSPLTDPFLPRPPATSQLDLRLGGKFNVTYDTAMDVSLFVNNVTNSQPKLALFHETPESQFYRAGSFRPRTVGLTVTLRK